jgi:hypothetical protein
MSSHIALHSLCQIRKPDIIFIAEPMVMCTQIPGRFLRSLNVFAYLEFFHDRTGCTFYRVS